MVKPIHLRIMQFTRTYFGRSLFLKKLKIMTFYDLYDICRLMTCVAYDVLWHVACCSSHVAVPIWGILGSNLRDPRIWYEGSQDPIWVIPGSDMRDPWIQSKGSQDQIWGILGSNLRVPMIQSERSQDPGLGTAFFSVRYVPFFSVL